MVITSTVFTLLRNADEYITWGIYSKLNKPGWQFIDKPAQVESWASS